MVLPLIIGGLAVAATAAGTIATLNAQRAQANAQAEASLQAALDAEERAQLAIERFGIIKESAKLIRDRELATISAQRQAAQMQVEQTLLQNRLAQLQSGLQASSLEFQGQSAQIQSQGAGTQARMGAQSEAFEMERGATNQLLGRGNEEIGQLNQAAQIGAENATAMSQAGQAFGQAEQVGQAIGAQGRQNSLSGMALQENALGQAHDIRGQTMANNQQRGGMAQFNIQQSRANYNLASQQLELARKYGTQNMGIADQYAALLTKMGDSQAYMANIAASSVRQNQSSTDQAVQLSAQTQKGINALQARRNTQAIRSGYNSTLATGNMSALGTVLQEKQNIAQALAQHNMAMAQRPGGMAYFGAIANGISAGVQLGLPYFGGGGSRAPQQGGGYQPAGVSNLTGQQAFGQQGGGGGATLTNNPYLNYSYGVMADYTGNTYG